MSAEVRDQPGGTVYAAGRALYVTPKAYADQEGGGNGNGSGHSAHGAAARK